MLDKEITIVNKLGLHARAAAKFVNLASGFESEINISRNGRTVNGKSIMGVMMLAASCGSAIKLSVSGKDEQEALRQLEQLIEDRFGEEA
ncbi:MAG: HPr family phosphocarrier protein [Gammaproteobacteria bacterium]|nr:HPr family phosphocarrier protein [Gammaproteobacteria bacterium]MCW8841257.1 HPr family phosphocarrier protein [Gammaproteobacteria bacterium]MCW8928336.1 HPr family phosphocarrier protein [Gammaproteobacteria bacterium]MCW8958182.1 HPr family phosphocarrier protein [Gammaproteobacteria bacterium]MCW8973235.1 HPr family phosphocarrier protein [Gammaproteobacteria bacterium]